MTDELFLPGITQHEFERRAVCKWIMSHSVV